MDHETHDQVVRVLMLNPWAVFAVLPLVANYIRAKSGHFKMTCEKYVAVNNLLLLTEFVDNDKIISP